VKVNQSPRSFFETKNMIERNLYMKGHWNGSVKSLNVGYYRKIYEALDLS
jgi:hypothetical protein